MTVWGCRACVVSGGYLPVWAGKAIPHSVRLGVYRREAPNRAGRYPRQQDRASSYPVGKVIRECNGCRVRLVKLERVGIRQEELPSCPLLLYLTGPN